MISFTSPALGGRAGDTTPPVLYRLCWRLRASGPWRREDFVSREEAFNRFFYLVGKGVQPHWEAKRAKRVGNGVME